MLPQPAVSAKYVFHPDQPEMPLFANNSIRPGMRRQGNALVPERPGQVFQQQKGGVILRSRRNRGRLP